jgi:hypothetical protein
LYLTFFDPVKKWQSQCTLSGPFGHGQLARPAWLVPIERLQMDRNKISPAFDAMGCHLLNDPLACGLVKTGAKTEHKGKPAYGSIQNVKRRKSYVRAAAELLNICAGECCPAVQDWFNALKLRVAERTVHL